MRKAGNLWVPDGDAYFAQAFQHDDVFERENLETALRFVTRWGIAVDGGAHVGSWTRYLARCFDEVHAYEPQPENLECLRANTAGLDNVRTYDTALSDKYGWVGLEPGTNGGGWHIAGEGRTYAGPLVDRGALDFLKLDIEGHEAEALIGCIDQLRKYKPVVLIEEKNLPHKPLDYAARDLLENLGYTQAAKIRRDVVFVCEGGRC
jgi:hypothetical protein